MLAASILAFCLILIWLFPNRTIARGIKTESELATELSFLILLRSQIQIDLPEDSNNFDSIYKDKIARYLQINKEYGISLIPLIEHLISTEQDRQKIVRELDSRSSTASGASTTLIFMPILMWLISTSLEINVFEFIFTPFGILIMAIGCLLTFVSRVTIDRTKKRALLLPEFKRQVEINPKFAAVITLVTIFLFSSNFAGFVIGVAAATLVNEFWIHIPKHQTLLIIKQLDEKTELLRILALLIETGITWTVALRACDSPELIKVSHRIEMGQSPAIAFENSEFWQEVGRLIANSVLRGTPVAQDLFRLSDEYRQQVLSYRIERVEQFAGRLIIPVNLLQIPAFILVGIVPMIAPMVIQILEGFHI